MNEKTKKLCLYSVVVLLLAAVAFLLIRLGKNSGTVTDEGVKQIHVENGRLEDEDGKAVQLTGMSSHGILWYPEYTNAGALQTLKSYGANTFRLAVYSDDPDGGYVQQTYETMRLTFMAIENVISADMYVIVDWHVLQDQNPLKNTENAKAFFEEISSHYGDCPNIIYEICNEPNGNTVWDDIYAYAGEVIPVIRNNAPNSVILVGTPDYSYSLGAVFEKPLGFNNVMYTFHFYAGMHDSYYNQLFDQCKSKNIPVFVSEWGIYYGADGKAALSQGETFAKVLNRRNISWIAWSLCDKDEIFSAIRPECEKLSGWEQEDLTDVGKIFFKNFR